MTIQGMDLVWIVVSDFKKALHFYTDVVGLKLEEMNEEYGWAELSGAKGGARLGIAKQSDREMIKPGQNGVVTLTVENLDHSMKELTKKGAKMAGEVIEVPGSVKMQMVKDTDGNHFQLVQLLSGKD